MGKTKRAGRVETVGTGRRAAADLAARERRGNVEPARTLADRQRDAWMAHADAEHDWAHHHIADWAPTSVELLRVSMRRAFSGKPGYLVELGRVGDGERRVYWMASFPADNGLTYIAAGHARGSARAVQRQLERFGWVEPFASFDVRSHRDVWPTIGGRPLDARMRFARLGRLGRPADELRRQIVREDNVDADARRRVELRTLHLACNGCGVARTVVSTLACVATRCGCGGRLS